jgi:carbon storage regulator
MLVLSRKPGEKIIIGGNITLTVVGVRGNQVKIGIDAPDGVRLFRGELAPREGRRAPPVPVSAPSDSSQGLVRKVSPCSEAP